MAKQHSGSVGGRFSTTKSGQSVYHLPIEVPPGTSKMEPSIAVSYVGNQQNGLLGVGFSLSGLPTIERAGQTMAQDGQWTAIDYSPHDRFQLSGERLIVVKGIYGAPGTEYRTERESWARIVSYGELGGGPEWFEVTSRSGRKMLFGSDASARVAAVGADSIRLWALCRVTDRSGNFYKVSYDLDAANGSHCPLSIDYTGNDMTPLALIPSRRVEFHYEDRPDPVRGYCGGHPFSQTRRLKAVATWVSADLVRTYAFDYCETAVTHRSELETVTESDREGVSRPPLTLTRPAEQTSWLAEPAKLPPVSKGPISENYTALHGDLTGDGRVDLILVWTTGDAELLEYAVFLAQADGGYAPPLFGATPCSLSGGQFGPVPVDINGNGLTDFILLYRQADALVYSTFVWATDKFLVSDPTSLEFPDLPSGFIPQLIPIDLTGDGKSDLFVPFVNNNQMDYYVLISNGTKYIDTEGAKSLSVPMESDYASMIFAANVSGSPIQEIVYGYSGTTENQIYVLSFDGHSFLANSPLQVSCGVGDDNYLIPISATGGNLTDVAFIWQDATMRLSLKVLVSDGTRIIEPMGSQPIIDLGQNAPAISPVDLTGDGRTDFLLYSLDGSGKTVVTPYLASRGTFVAQPSVATDLDVQPSAITTPDIRGIGRNDLLIATTDAQSGALLFHLFRSSAAGLGLVQRISNGTGGTISIEYLPTSDPRVYSESARPSKGINLAGRCAAACLAPVTFGPASGATAPGQVRHEIELPSDLVWRVTRCDGRGQTYVKEYHYGDGLVSLDGRGWLGFASSTTADLDTSSKLVTTYHQDFPRTGLVISESTGWVGQPLALRVRIYNYEMKSGVNEKVYVTQVHQSTTTFHAELGGSVASQSAVHTYDDFGNQLTTIYSSAQAGAAADLFTTRTFDNDTDGWCLGLLRSEVVSAVAAGQQVLRKQEHTYDPTTKQLASTNHWNSSDPNDSPTYTYRYDPYGNRASVAANNGALTTYAFGPETAYTYPNSRTRNVSGTNLTDTFVYDPRFGLMIARRDVNGNVRQRDLDGLGRVVRVSIPGPKGLAAYKTIERQSDFDGGYIKTTTTMQSWEGTLNTVKSEYFDGLGRLYSTTEQGEGDPPVALRVVDRRLNSAGKEVGRSLPYQSGEAVLWLTKSVDPIGRAIEHIWPIGPNEDSVTKIWYDGIDRTIVRGQGSPDAVASFERAQLFNGKPRVVERIDGRGLSSTFQFDPLGRVKIATPPGGASQTVQYNSLGVKSVIETAELGRAESVVRFAERVASVSYANGGGFRASLDVLGRPVTISLSDGLQYDITYDAPGPGNGMGRLTSVSATRRDIGLLYTWRQQYDVFGQSTLLGLSIRGQTFEQRRAYSPSGLIETLVFHDKAVARYTYDGLGQIRKLTYEPLDGKERPVATYDGYNAFGRPVAGVAGNGVQRRWCYTEGGLIRSQQVAGPGAHGVRLFARSFTRDTFGRILTIRDAITDRELGSYSYDGADQLQLWTDPYGVAHSIRFDTAGNVLETGSRALIYNKASIEVTPAVGAPYTLTSDPSGNRISTSREPAQTYKYDALNRLVATGLVEFIYDHQGRRLLKSSAGGHQTVYVTADDIIHSRGSDSTVVRLLRDQHGVAAVLEEPAGAASRLYFLEYDQVGSTVLVTNESGAVAAEPRYEPFGRLVNPTAGLSPFLPGFGGQAIDPETGLAYFNARYLDLDVGRFITADTRLGGSLTTTNALNRYTFALNDPINLADPSGHGVFEWLCSAIVSLLEIIGGAALVAGGGGSLGGALIGAGIGGLIYDIQAAARGQQFSWAGWGMAEGIGAVTGFEFGALSATAGAVEGGTAGLAGDAGELSESAEASFSESAEASENDVFIRPSTGPASRPTGSFSAQDDLSLEYDRFEAMRIPKEVRGQIFREWYQAEISEGGLFSKRVSRVEKFLQTFYEIGPEYFKIEISFDDIALAVEVDDAEEFEGWFATTFG
jgi:RHS repeat-associated protein